jgi:septum formation protein
MVIMFRIILASESPRRKEIMETMGIPFLSVPSNVEEVVEEKEPAEMVMALAAKKVRHVAGHLPEEKEDRIIIGADTMVFYKDHALGKPKDKEDAARMLRMLSDSVHEVFTGVHIIIRRNGYKDSEISFAVCTSVTVQPLTTEQIEDYITTGEPMDKAGAYAIQGKFGIHIREISGDYYNIVGFPIAQIYAKLLEQGIDIKKLK